MAHALTSLMMRAKRTMPTYHYLGAAAPLLCCALMVACSSEQKPEATAAAAISPKPAIQAVNMEKGLNPKDSHQLKTLASTPPMVLKKTESPTSSHTVRVGETLFRIAQMYEITELDIMLLNNISDPHTLRSGTTLKIPDPYNNLFASY